jgi:hypothetical protein
MMASEYVLECKQDGKPLFESVSWFTIKGYGYRYLEKAAQRVPYCPFRLH